MGSNLLLELWLKLAIQFREVCNYIRALLDHFKNLRGLVIEFEEHL